MTADKLAMARKLWEHPDPKSTEMYRLMQEINQKHDLQLKTFWDLYQHSVTSRSQFWDQAFQFLGLIYSGSYTTVVDEGASIDTIPRWFNGVRLNFAENILYTRFPGASSSSVSTLGKEDEKIALTEVREGCTEIRDITWGQLRKEVSELATAMREHGVQKGDRVVAVASNSCVTLKVFLAVTWLGGLYSSSSTDMGVQGILQRTLQVTPKYIFFDDYTIYNGKTIDLRPKIKEIVNGMLNVPEFKEIISLPRFQNPADITAIPRTRTLSQFLTAAKSKQVPPFNQIAFHDPFYIAYSSGTTGTPKCIVHSVGGCLLSAFKDVKLHVEMTASSVVLQYTTTGWIMYLISVMNLVCGARIVLYDGSPFIPDLTTFVKLIGDLGVTRLGTSPKWLGELAKNGIMPKNVTDLGKLKMVSSTGMVLSDKLFEWFYDVGFPAHVHLCNISGGTDLAGCFGQENPLTPVYVGGVQGPSLGTPVAVYDSTNTTGKGVELPHGEAGELVAPNAFPNMPVFFWNDIPPSSPTFPSSLFFAAYFSKIPQVWTHGDYISIHPSLRTITFLGRSDGVLNPSGIRFGSSEIYAVIESEFLEEVADSLCVGQRRERDEDEVVMLFLIMKDGKKFSGDLVARVKEKIAGALSKRHVPRWVFETGEIPTTVNLKKVELPVKQIVSGKVVKASGTLLNPKSLEYYYQFAKVEELVANEKLKGKGKEVVRSKL